MRWCNVEADLVDFQKYRLEASKLSGEKVRGQLEDLNWDELKFLDLRDAKAKAVTGNLSSVGLAEHSPLERLLLEETYSLWCAN